MPLRDPLTGLFCSLIGLVCLFNQLFSSSKRPDDASSTPTLHSTLDPPTYTRVHTHTYTHSRTHIQRETRRCLLRATPTFLRQHTYTRNTNLQVRYSLPRRCLLRATLTFLRKHTCHVRLRPTHEYTHIHTHTHTHTQRERLKDASSAHPYTPQPTLLLR